MTDILRIFFIIILLTIALAAYFLVIGTLFTNCITKTQRVISQMPGRAFGVGFVNFMFFGVILIVLFTITDGNANRVSSVIRGILLIPTLTLAALLSGVLSFGLAGMANILGERIFPESNALKRNIYGTVVLSFACALPVVGWFLLFPYAGFVGIGAFILGLFQRETPA
jgi:hypothetical protein